jgi:hypothetical protein
MDFKMKLLSKNKKRRVIFKKARKQQACYPVSSEPRRCKGGEGFLKKTVFPTRKSPLFAKPRHP